MKSNQFHFSYFEIFGTVTANGSSYKRYFREYLTSLTDTQLEIETRVDTQILVLYSD